MSELDEALSCMTELDKALSCYVATKADEAFKEGYDKAFKEGYDKAIEKNNEIKQQAYYDGYRDCLLDGEDLELDDFKNGLQSILDVLDLLELDRERKNKPNE